MTLWEGRISTGMADTVAAFTVSLPFDRTLARDDLAGSRAHVKGLGKAGILSDSEVASLIDALDIVEEEFATGVFAFAPDDEDVHTAIERRATELAGDADHEVAHRSQSQRPGRHRPETLVPSVAGGRRGRDHGPGGHAGAKRRGHRRRLPSGLHPSATGAAGAPGPSPVGARLGPVP